jgi:hypothetical protein
VAKEVFLDRGSGCMISKSHHKVGNHNLVEVNDNHNIGS